VTRNIIDEKSGRVLEVDTEVTTEDSDEEIINEDGTVTKNKSKRKMRRGKTGGQNQTFDQNGEPIARTRRRRRRKLSPDSQNGMKKY
jgi:hypothetical protein